MEVYPISIDMDEFHLADFLEYYMSFCIFSHILEYLESSFFAYEIFICLI